MKRGGEPPSRVVVEGVFPSIDCGRFPVKRIVGDSVIVGARIHADGHDCLGGAARVYSPGEKTPIVVPLAPSGNDLWKASFRVDRPGRYEFEIAGWIDPIRTWQEETRRKTEADLDVGLELRTGSNLIRRIAGRVGGSDGAILEGWARDLEEAAVERRGAALLPVIQDPRGGVLPRSHPADGPESTSPRYGIQVDRDRARFGSWYELFPRSFSATPGRHGTFEECERVLPYVAAMGFDVLYLPPIHPIGHSHRKGKNNSPVCEPEDVGSPWAIGSEEGGHTAIHPRLGTIEDFQRFRAKATENGLEVAIDIAFQCSPDHPWVREHPDWFRRRADGSVQYAENPPKKYQDIYPLDFSCGAWESLWESLKEVVAFWAEQGIRIFRVDNPHTKPYRFWEWLIGEIQKKWPDALFLSEAFTRPSVMRQLAKLGFSQSYDYFPWRNTSWELREYFTELTTTDLSEYFRPNLWPNTPDILPEFLQAGGQRGFLLRVMLAGTLGPSYGIYGPAFELCEARPIEPGREEYLDSEKYELRRWDLGDEKSLAPWIARLNRIRRENPALQAPGNLRFQDLHDDRLLLYSKSTDDRSNIIVVAANLDPHTRRTATIRFSIRDLGLDPKNTYSVRDLIEERDYLWSGDDQELELTHETCPVRILRIRGIARTEQDFDYY